MAPTTFGWKNTLILNRVKKNNLMDTTNNFAFILILMSGYPQTCTLSKKLISFENLKFKKLSFCVWLEKRVARDQIFLRAQYQNLKYLTIYVLKYQNGIENGD